MNYITKWNCILKNSTIYKGALEKFMGDGNTLNFDCDSDYMTKQSSKPTQVYT